MATVPQTLDKSTEFGQFEDVLVDVNLSGATPYYTSRPSYKKEIIPDIESLTTKEKIQFIIDCYAIFYERIMKIEDRLLAVETQNREILLLLGKGEEGVMRLVTDDFVEMSADQMKEKILEYYKSHMVVYPSDIAFELNFDLEKVVKTIDDLIREGRVVETS